MKIFLVSKKNTWSDKLYHLIKDNIIVGAYGHFDCLYFNDDSYKKYLEYNSPDWVFFLHWSKKVPEKVYKNYRCVVLHTGNLPNGRGGSPIQNQILDGVVESKVNAIVMGEEIDAGDVYCSLPITLQGSLTDIWLSIVDRAYELIRKCIFKNPKPKKQGSNASVYLRNKNNILPLDNTKDINLSKC